MHGFLGIFNKIMLISYGPSFSIQDQLFNVQDKSVGSFGSSKGRSIGGGHDRSTHSPQVNQTVLLVDMIVSRVGTI